MSSISALRAVARRNVFAVSKPRFPSAIVRRSLATTAPVNDDGKLPLKGLKVLDMTRVLAGVSSCHLFLSYTLEYGD